jgi:hypothetical protein
MDPLASFTVVPPQFHPMHWQNEASSAYTQLPPPVDASDPGVPPLPVPVPPVVLLPPDPLLPVPLPVGPLLPPDPLLLVPVVDDPPAPATVVAPPVGAGRPSLPAAHAKTSAVPAKHACRHMNHRMSRVSSRCSFTLARR